MGDHSNHKIDSLYFILHRDSFVAKRTNLTKQPSKTNKQQQYKNSFDLFTTMLNFEHQTAMTVVTSATTLTSVKSRTTGPLRMRSVSNTKIVRFLMTPPIIIPADHQLHATTTTPSTSTWYTSSDLDQMRSDARAACRAMRESAQPCRQRGLEQRCCLMRQRKKYLANKWIVHCKLEGDALAAMAQKCTGWATRLAEQEGARDYVRAYKTTATDDADDTTGNVPTVMATTTNTSSRKRVNNNTEEENERNVRSRLILVE
jgi:uncharacterized protein YdaT